MAQFNLHDEDSDDVVDYYESAQVSNEATRFLKPSIIGAEVVAITGVLLLSFVGYQQFGTTAVAKSQQQSAMIDLREGWDDHDTESEEPFELPGGAFSILHAPDMSEQEFPVFKGTDQATLAQGPGTYGDDIDFAEKGNVGIAAHRDGWNAPFSEIDKLETCSEITIEDVSRVYEDRVPSSAADPNVRYQENADCFGEKAASILDREEYAELKGQHIVDPSQGSVVWSVPGETKDKSKARLPLLTLTSCHPHMSNEQRIIAHAVLTDISSKGL